MLESRLKAICDRAMKDMIFDYGDPNIPFYIPEGVTITVLV